MYTTANNLEFAGPAAPLGSRWATASTSADSHLSLFSEKDAALFFSRLGVPPGVRLLDVGPGAGQLALVAARAGCRVAESDAAESLPYADAQFDVVVSCQGAMFASQPDLVASELTRVCRPGGLVAMANWTPGSLIGRLLRTVSRHIAPSQSPPPVLWGDEWIVRRRFGQRVSDLECARRICHLRYPFPPEELVSFLHANYSPVARAFAALDVKAQQRLNGELVRLCSLNNKAAAGATHLHAEYLEVLATRC